MTLTKQQQDRISRDWISAVNDLVLDEKYGEITGYDRRSMRSPNGKFLPKFQKDTEEFSRLVIRVRELQAKELLAQDPEYFDYLTDPAQYCDFAMYGGTECRLLYRAYFMLKGYRAFRGWDSMSYDGAGVKWYADMFKQAMAEAAE